MKLLLKRNNLASLQMTKFKKLIFLFFIFSLDAPYRHDLHSQKQQFFVYLIESSFQYFSPFPDPAEKPAEVFAQTVSSVCHY